MRLLLCPCFPVVRCLLACFPCPGLPWLLALVCLDLASRTCPLLALREKNVTSVVGFPAGAALLPRVRLLLVLVVDVRRGEVGLDDLSWSVAAVSLSLVVSVAPGVDGDVLAAAAVAREGCRSRPAPVVVPPRLVPLSPPARCCPIRWSFAARRSRRSPSSCPCVVEHAAGSSVRPLRSVDDSVSAPQVGRGCCCLLWLLLLLAMLLLFRSCWCAVAFDAVAVTGAAVTAAALLLLLR